MATSIKKPAILDVELLSSTGGGRTYSYAYSLHYKKPEKGEVVIVPFAGKLFPAVVLNANDTDTASGLHGKQEIRPRHLRPVLGVARSSAFLLRAARLAEISMEDFLKNAETAFSMWLPAPVHKAFAVFFFAVILKRPRLT